MTRWALSCAMVSLLSSFLSAQPALPHAGTGWSFLAKYLDDTFRSIDPADTRFTGRVVVEVPGTKLALRDLRDVTFADTNGDGRADIIVPVCAMQDDGAIHDAGMSLVFVNEPVVPFDDESDKSPHFRLAILGPNIASGSFDPFGGMTGGPLRADVTGPTSRGYYADLNGDGLSDGVTLTLAEPWLDGSFALDVSGVTMNIGPAFVPEEHLGRAVCDARLGYMASYALTEMAGLSDARTGNADFAEASGVPPPRLPMGTIKTSSASEYYEGKPAVSAQEPVTSEPSTKQPRPVRDLFRAHPEINFDVVYGYRDFEHPAPMALPHLPFPPAYASGLEWGRFRARQALGDFSQGAAMLRAASSAVEGLRVAVQNEDESVLLSQARTLSKSGRTLARLCSDTDIGGGRWLAFLNSPLLSPREMDASLLEVPQEYEVAAIATTELRQKAKALDASWVLCSDSQVKPTFFVNSPRLVGTAVAFLVFTQLRQRPDYGGKVAHAPLDVKHNAEEAQQWMCGDGKRLDQLVMVSDADGVGPSDFVQASVVSGFSQLTDFVAADASAEAFRAGYAKRESEELQLIKDALAGQVPGLDGAANVKEALDVIGHHIGAQRDEIVHLRSSLAALQDTNKKLQDDLDSAGKLIAGLQETNDKLRDALGQWERAGQNIADITGMWRDEVRVSWFVSGGPVVRRIWDKYLKNNPWFGGGGE